MPDTAVAEPPVVEPSTLDRASDAFTANLAARNAETSPAAAPATPQTTPAPAAQAPTKEPAAESIIPDELLTGEKPAAPVEADEILDAEPPKGLSQKGQVNWKRLQETTKSRIAVLTAELKAEREAKAAHKPDEQTVAEIKAANERASELERLLEQKAFESSPKFQVFTKKERQQIDAAKTYLEGTEVNPDAIELAARAIGSKRIAILREAGADAETIAAVSPYLAHYDNIQRDKADAISNSKQFAAQWEAEEKLKLTAEEARTKQLEEDVYAKIGVEISKTFAPFQKLDGNDKWNAQVDQLNAEAKQFFAGELPLPELAKVAYMGVGARVILQINEALRTRLKSAMEENSRLKSAQPRAGDSSVTGAATDNNANPLDRGTAMFERIMGR